MHEGLKAFVTLSSRAVTISRERRCRDRLHFGLLAVCAGVRLSVG